MPRPCPQQPCDDVSWSHDTLCERYRSLEVGAYRSVRALVALGTGHTGSVTTGRGRRRAVAVVELAMHVSGPKNIIGM